MEVRLYNKVSKNGLESIKQNVGTYKRYNGGDWFVECIQQSDDDEYILRTYTTLKTGCLNDGTNYEVLKKMPQDWLSGFYGPLITQEPKSLVWNVQELNKLEFIGDFEVKFLQAETYASCLNGEYKKEVELLLEEVSEPNSSLQLQPHEQQVQKPSQQQHQPSQRRPQRHLQQPSELNPSRHHLQRQEVQRLRTRQPSHLQPSQILQSPQAPREQYQDSLQGRSVPSRKCPSHISGRLMEPQLVHS